MQQTSESQSYFYNVKYRWNWIRASNKLSRWTQTISERPHSVIVNYSLLQMSMNNKSVRCSACLSKITEHGKTILLLSPMEWDCIALLLPALLLFYLPIKRHGCHKRIFSGSLKNLHQLDVENMAQYSLPCETNRLIWKA